jgi:hypothetical protein
MQAYSNPKREDDAHALPDVEVFYHKHGVGDGELLMDEDGNDIETGWYWWACLPGCLPDGEPNGPFASCSEALEDAQSAAWEDSEDTYEVF